jgi:hypothetical protein
MTPVVTSGSWPRAMTLVMTSGSEPARPRDSPSSRIPVVWQQHCIAQRCEECVRRVPPQPHCCVRASMGGDDGGNRACSVPVRVESIHVKGADSQLYDACGVQGDRVISVQSCRKEVVRGWHNYLLKSVLASNHAPWSWSS